MDLPSLLSNLTLTIPDVLDVKHAVPINWHLVVRFCFIPGIPMQ